MSFFAGIDIGSSYTKICLIDEKKKIIAEDIVSSGISFEKTSKKILRRVFKKINGNFKINDIKVFVSTGVGRYNFPFKKITKTEISCLVKGMTYYFSGKGTIIDIGAEDVKMVQINEEGEEVDFKMNRKCAAGTGAFIEEISRKLRMPLKKLNNLAEQAKKSIEINSFCTVFAGTEIIHLIREGKDIKEIARGVFESFVNRILSMVKVEGKLFLAGGAVAHNPFLLKVFEEKTGITPLVPPNPQTLVAFGAALFALENKKKIDV